MGCSFTHAVEKEFNVQLGKKVEQRLQQLGYQVVLMRPHDETMTVGDRTTKAHKHHADMFVSIHGNSGPASHTGFQVFYCDSSAITHELEKSSCSKKHIFSQESKRWGKLSKELASRIQFKAVKMAQGKAKDLGVKAAALQVLWGFQGPAVLIEAGYLSNPDERKRLLSSDYQDTLAQGIAEGIKTFVEKHFA